MKRGILLVGLLACVSVANADSGAAAADQAASLAQVQAGYQINWEKIQTACGQAPDGLSCGTNNPCTEEKLEQSRAWTKCAMAQLMPTPADVLAK